MKRTETNSHSLGRVSKAGHSTVVRGEHLGTGGRHEVHAAGRGKWETIMINVCDVLLVGGARQDADAIRDLLAEASGQGFRLHHADSLSAALDRLGAKAIDAALLETSLPDSTPLEAVTSIRIHAPAVPVLVLSAIEDEAMAYGAVRSGAEDCLVKSRLDGPGLVRAIQYAIARNGRKKLEASAEEEEAPVIGIMGAKGGVGTTTIACHLGVALKQLTGKPVLVADLDLFGGQAGFLLRAQSSHTVADAAASVHRLDADCWKGMVAQAPVGVDVLLSPGLDYIDEMPSLRDVRHVLRIVRSWYSTVIVDLGCLNSVSVELLSVLTELLLVTTPELQSLRGAKSVLAKLPQIGAASERTRIVLNRSSQRATITREETERVLARRVYAALPNNYAALAVAYEAGQLLPGKEELNRQFTALAAQLCGVEIAAEPAGRFSRFLKTFKGGVAEVCPELR